MSEDGRKKISFGFTKTASVPVINKPASKARGEDDKIEFIESLEDKEFKTIGLKEQPKEELVIPLKVSIPQWQRRLLKQRAEAELNSSDGDFKSISLDEQAAQELIRDAETAMKEKETNRKVHTIPLAEEDEETVEEDKDEPTMENYDSVPVVDFGLAMLRGMGWTPGRGIGKNPKIVTASEPNIRPRGMGLGADVRQPAKIKSSSSAQVDEELRLTRKSCVKITEGALTGCYAKVESFDDSCGRILVRMALGGKTQNICEYMVEVVSSKEYKEKAKIITSENAALVRRSTDELKNGDPSKNYGLLKAKKRCRSPLHKN